MEMVEVNELLSITGLIVYILSICLQYNFYGERVNWS